MAAARRRLGSVSAGSASAQAFGMAPGPSTPLPPLDIQSIQMPLNPQNALALKTAALSSTKSLYQTCSDLRKRLRRVEGFQDFLEQPPTAEPQNVVNHVCHTLRLGSSLIHLYNLLLPAFSTPTSTLYSTLPNPQPIPYDFPAFMTAPNGVHEWARQPENAKSCKKYIASFSMAMWKLKKDGRWHESDELWAVHELWGEDTGGLMKVLYTVDLMLDSMPESALLSPTSPTTPHPQSAHSHHQSISNHTTGPHDQSSYDIPFSMGGTGPGAGGISTMAANMHAGLHTAERDGEASRRASMAGSSSAYRSVEELVASERTYVQELEVLQRYSRELLQYQLVTPDTVHLMFSNLGKVLDFHRRFLTQLETQFEPVQEVGPTAWCEGRWGFPFVEFEEDFAVYGPYCANFIDAASLITSEMVNLKRGEELPEGEKPCLNPETELSAFLIKPIQRVTKYKLLLEAILKETAKHEYRYRSELEDGLAASVRIANDVNDVLDSKEKSAIVRELWERVEDWKGHDLASFGQLYMDDHFSVTKGTDVREYHIFLFDKMLLCCKEVSPDRKDSKKMSKSSSMLRKDKSLNGKPVPPPKKPLALKGRIYVSNISQTQFVPTNVQPFALEVFWKVQASASGPAGLDSFVLIGRSDEQVGKWNDKIHELVRLQAIARQRDAAERRPSQSHYTSPSSQFAPITPAAERPPNGGFNYFPTEDKWDSDEAFSRSGRSTPSGGFGPGSYPMSVSHSGSRRTQSTQGVPPDRQAEMLRARAYTEDQNGPSMQQWRNQQPSASLPAMPPMPRLMSASSATSEASFGNPAGVRQLKSQMSQAKLGRSNEESDEAQYASYPGQYSSSGSDATVRGPPSRLGMRGDMVRTPSQGLTPTMHYPQAPPLRMRSASSPNVYQMPKVASSLPPVPAGRSSPQAWNDSYFNEPSYNPSKSTLGTSASTNSSSAYLKRASASSNATEVSETSSHSPVTPYSNGVASGSLPVSRQGSGDSGRGSLMMCKVHFVNDLFVIGVAPNIGFATLAEKVQKKVRLCGARKDDTPLRLYYKDEDDDRILVACDDDVQLAFEGSRQNTVELYVSA